MVLISRYAGNVDLDLDCVLYGVIEYTPLYTVNLMGFDVPQAFLQIAGVFLLSLLVVGLLFKELKIASFDPEMATAVGINATLMHYVLMGLVSLTAVGSFEPVGAILVVAMLCVPPAMAYLLTDDLKTMLILAVVGGVLSAIGGFYMAQSLDASTAGCMSVVAGILFAGAFFFSPRYGVVLRHFERLEARAQRGARRCVASLVARARTQRETIGCVGIGRFGQNRYFFSARALNELVKSGLATAQNGGFVLTEAGRGAAQELSASPSRLRIVFGRVGLSRRPFARCRRPHRTFHFARIRRSR